MNMRPVLPGRIFPLSASQLAFLGGCLLAFLVGHLVNQMTPVVGAVACAFFLLCLLVAIKQEMGLYLTALFGVVGGMFSFASPSLPQICFAEVMLAVLISARAISLLAGGRASAFSPVDAPLGLILLLSCVSMVGVHAAGTIPPQAYRWQIKAFLMIVFSIGAYSITLNLAKDKKIIRGVVGAILASSVPMSFTQYYHFVKNGMSIGYEHRVYSFLSGNFLGAYYVLVLSLAVALFLYSEGDAMKKCIYGVLASVIAFNILITFSRATFLSAAAALGLILFLRCRTTSAVSFVLAALLLAVFPAPAKKVTDIFDPKHVSGTLSRLPIFKDAIGTIKRHPIFGIGLDSHQRHARLIVYLDALGEERPVSSSHNDFLQMAVNIGVSGLLAFLWFLWRTWTAAMRAYKESQDAYFKHILLASLAIIASFFIQSFFSESIFGCFDNGGWAMFSSRIYFWIVLGLSMSIGRIEKAVRGEMERVAK